MDCSRSGSNATTLSVSADVNLMIDILRIVAYTVK